MMRNKIRKWLSTTIAAALCFSLTAVLPQTEASAASDLPFYAEAEACTLDGGVVEATAVYDNQLPGYTGTGFAWMTNGGSISFEVTVPETGMYEISTVYTQITSEDAGRLQYLYVNDVNKGSFSFDYTREWTEFSFGVQKLTAGTNTISIVAQYGFANFDSVSVGEGNLPELDVDPTCCDTNATSETQSLMNYLDSVYGDNIISGQQEIYGSGHDGDYEYEFDWLYDLTGEYPAIRGFDYMNFNPLYGWDDGTTGRAIDWVVNQGGIATVCWHINVPTNFAGYTLGEAVDWTSATYKPESTDFDTANAVIEGTKENEYLKLAIADLAEQLLMLQDAKVPVIFRPYHEAEGNGGADGAGAWFWWGAAGAETYTALWEMLYNTLTEEYGLHNLIWEFNSYTYASSPAWYPGNDYVDIVAFDKYNTVYNRTDGLSNCPNEDAISSTFYTLVELTGGTRMVAMAENDTVPALQNLIDESAGWLYFCPWYEENLMDASKNNPETLTEMYQSDYCITLDELPDDLYGYTRGNGGNYDVAGAYEFEDGAIVTNGDTTVVDYKSCSGGAYVFLKAAEDTDTLTITADKAGVYALNIGYQQLYEELGKTQNLYVNGTLLGEIFFPYAQVFTETETQYITLKAGTNTLMIESVEGWMYLDYATVEYYGESMPENNVAGDVDGNGTVEVADLILLQKYLVMAGDLTTSQANRADMDADNTLDVFDMLLIKRILCSVD